MSTPEQEARKAIDELLHSAGWDVQNIDSVNIFSRRGVAIREFPLNTGHGFADYLRLSRLNAKLTEKDKAAVKKINNGDSLQKLTADLVAALNPDHHREKAASLFGYTGEFPQTQIKAAASAVISHAVAPLMSPELRRTLLELKKKNEQTIDHISEDQVISAGFDAHALEKAKGMIDSFKAFVDENEELNTHLVA